MAVGLPGQQKCAPCHPREVTAFAASPMGRSLSDPAKQAAGKVEHQKSGSQVSIGLVRGAMEHRLDHRGLTARHEVAYSVGAGQVGYSYLVRIGAYLFQSPVSYYTQTHSWDLTPGYESESVLDFDHPVLSGCLFCHTGSVRFARGSKNQYEKDALSPISCERCHDASEEHIRRPVVGTILNPAKLKGAARDSVCEQCHLEGETRILNPGADWWDFKPGAATEQVFATYVRSFSDRRIPAVSQAEQLRQSACSRGSGGKLWCGSCHNPHGKQLDTREVCLSCHASLFASAKHAPAAECKSCHMPPLRATNVAHAALTDHRIPRRPGPSQAKAASERPLIAWREPAANVRQRDLGLAFYEAGATHQDWADLERGYNLLKPLAASSAGDVDVEAALGSMLAGMGEADAAVGYLEKACLRSPDDARLRFLLGAALAGQGRLPRAATELEQAIRLDPSMQAAYEQLAAVYGRMGNEAMRRRTIDSYLKFMPDSIRFRLKR